MQHLTLERFAYMPAGTLGRLTLPDGQILITIERPWLNNQRNKSCIPEGQYQVEPYSSEKFPDAFQIMNVPDRSYILFHSANYADQVQGCIAPGLTMSMAHGQLSVQNSRAAMGRLLNELDRQPWVLTITHKAAVLN